MEKIKSHLPAIITGVVLVVIILKYKDVISTKACGAMCGCAHCGVASGQYTGETGVGSDQTKGYPVAVKLLVSILILLAVASVVQYMSKKSSPYLQYGKQFTPRDFIQ